MYSAAKSHVVSVLGPPSTRYAVHMTLELNRTASTAEQLNSLLTQIMENFSVSDHEGPLTDEVEAFLNEQEHLTVRRHGDTVVASTDFGKPSRVILAGHLDTVPVIDNFPPKWLEPGDSLIREEIAHAHPEDRVLWGRGATDMKASDAVMLYLAATLDGRTPETTPKVDLTYVFYDHEEVVAEKNGLRKVVEAHPDWITGDFAIIGEPTSLQPIRAHKGHMSNAIRIQGQSGHSSDPARGVNAIELMHDAIGRIMQLRDLLKERYHFEAFTVPYPTLNLGAIHGGDASNRICACCELHMDIRPLPGMTLNDLNGLLGEALAPVSERWPGRLTVSELHPPIPGYECPPDHKLVQVVEKLLGAQTDVVNYCTEAPFIQTLCPTLVLGPGSINQAHQPDEYLETRFIKPTRELISQVVHHFCWH